MNNFFDTTFNLDSEKQKIIDFINMKKNQSAAEAVFFDKYHEIQACSGEKFKINTLKNKVWNESDISNLKPKVILVDTKEQLDDWRYLIRFTSSFKNVSNPGRNMKFLVEDETTGKYIGWTRDDRYKNKRLNNVACGQAIIPMQPLGHNFLGGKLMALMITSDVIRKSWEEKYGDILVGMTTTSLYGTCSQYNNMPTFKKRGKTTGKIPLKLPKEMIRVWETYFQEKRKIRSNLDVKIFRECGLKLKDYQSDKKRGIYFCSFYDNTNDFLQNNIKESSLKLRQDFVYYNNLISEWWKPKSEKRFNKLKSDNKLISELHFWDKLFGLTYEEAKQNYLGEVGR